MIGMRMRGLLAVLMVIALGAVAQSVKAPYTVEVVASHWIAVRFEPQYPHGRHTQNPLPGASLNLPLAESLMIKGQAGQSSDNQRDVAEYRIPVPDVAADAVVDRVIFLGDMQGDVRQMPLLDGVKAAAAPCPEEACSAMKLPAGVKIFAADIARPLNPAELTIELKATEAAYEGRAARGVPHERAIGAGDVGDEAAVQPVHAGHVHRAGGRWKLLHDGHDGRSGDDGGDFGPISVEVARPGDVVAGAG